jgi:hypothetical protein
MQLSIDVVRLLREDVVTEMILSLVCRSYALFHDYHLVSRCCRLDTIADSIVARCNILIVELFNICELPRRAARTGRLDLLKQQYYSGVELPSNICNIAAINGQLEILQWCRRIGCSWNELTFGRAVRSGSLDLLMWLRSENCPWDEWTTTIAAADGRLEILQWARSSGCPWHIEECETVAIAHGQSHVVDWIRSQNSEYPSR